MIHTFLLNIGFVQQEDGSYFNNELNLRVTIVDEEHVMVPTSTGERQATIEELEEAIIGGGYGEF